MAGDILYSFSWCQKPCGDLHRMLCKTGIHLLEHSLPSTEQVMEVLSCNFQDLDG
jgi:hypothetical protein